MDFLDKDMGEELSDSELTFGAPDALEPTFSVNEINEAISLAIDRSFPDEIWVKGEIQRLNFHSSGHIYFNLCDSAKGSNSTIPASLFKFNASKIKGNLRELLVEDREVRLKVKPNFYAPYGKMSLVVSAIDSAFSLGQIAIARRELLEKLNNEGILRANSLLELDELPTNIVLITALDSAAYHDVTDQLKNSRIGFSIKVINALVQGAESPRSVVAALKHGDSLDADVILLCRGGGSKSDLSSFDSEVVARTICAMQTPVVTGLGHQIDIAVADMVAHTSVKTPTACAQFLIERVETAIASAENVASSIASSVEENLVATQTRLAFISQRLSDSNIVLERATTNIDSNRAKIINIAVRELELTKQKLTSWSSLVTAHDPQRVLERGFSITLNNNGELVSSVKNLETGNELQTRLADGQVTSTVKTVKEK